MLTRKQLFLNMTVDSLSPDVVGEFGRNDHRDLTETSDLAVLFPRTLEDHLVDSVFFDCVGVRAPVFQKVTDNGH